MTSLGGAYKSRGKTAVELFHYMPRDADLVAAVRGMEGHVKVVVVVVDPRSNAANKIKLLRDAGLYVVEPDARAVAAATGDFLDLMASGDLVHVPAPALDAAVKAGVDRRLAGGQAWDRYAAGPVDPSPAVAALLAVWGLTYHGVEGVGVVSIREVVERLQAERAGVEPSTVDAPPPVPGQRFIPLEQAPAYPWRGIRP